MSNQTKRSVEQRILRGTVIILAMTILAKLASFLTDAILAAYLGTSYQADAYHMISGIQNVIYPMMSVGIWKVFLPLYKSHVAKGELEKANHLADKSITIFTLFSLVLSVLIFVFNDTVVSLVAPGFTGDTKILCAKLVRLASPMYVLTIAASIYSCLLQCHDKFVGSQIREVATYIPTIIAAIFFYKRFGIEAMAISLAVGGLVRLLVQLPFVDWGFRYKPDFHFKDPDLAVFAKRLPSALLSEGVAKLNTLVDKIMASSLATGSVSALNYGLKLNNVFSGVVSTSVSTAFYPQIVELVTHGLIDKLNELLTKIECIFAIIMFPISIGCAFFAGDLVRAAFQRGAFSADAVLLTAGIFTCYCVGFFFSASNSIMSKILFSYGDTKTPFYLSLIHLVINVCGNLILVSRMGARGLALATALSAMATFFIRLPLLKGKAKLDVGKVVIASVKAIIAGTAACALARFVTMQFRINKYVDLLIAAAICIVVYLPLLKLMKVEEYDMLMGLIKKKIKKMKRGK